ncbi:hypothetical protein BE21_38865 [Sorangium cellulosum]|uniref:Secreted protein n=1 Tax=Sorangium cellulosum TaxID=56 RepID=A0A150TMA8_SORCE|nr:hypothetical protein BE21_38865 [Sorangium cellulosum]
MMRPCRRGWLSGGLALALSVPALLTGCAFAPGERDEQADDAWSELEPTSSDEALVSDTGGEDVERDVAAPAADRAELPRLRLREASPPAGGDEGSRARTYVRSRDTQMPEPLPWHPKGSSDGDGTR